MAAMKSALLVTVLLLLGTPRTSAACTESLQSCITIYNTGKAAGACVAVAALKTCISPLLASKTCLDSDISSNNDIQTAYASSPCSGAIPKASIVSLLVVTVIGFFVKA